MKVVILAGGYGTRFGSLTDFLPKPMIPVGPMPILWHIIKHYIHHGHDEFIICTGYKSHLIKDFFLNLDSFSSDFEVDFRHKDSRPKFLDRSCRLKAKVTVCYTGQNTMTGGRLLRVAEHLGEDENFLLTYGDGVSNVPIDELIKFHKEHGKLATLTAVYPPPKFGNLQFDGNMVSAFAEKTGHHGSLINGGFYVMKRDFLQLIENKTNCVLEKEPLEQAARSKQLVAFRHEGFWQCMDTKRDLDTLQEAWDAGSAPWKTWCDDGYTD